MEQLMQTILSDKLYVILAIILIVFIVLFIIKKLFKWVVISLLIFIAFLIYAHYKGESIKDVLKKTFG
jgi:predicted membrane protein